MKALYNSRCKGKPIIKEQDEQMNTDDDLNKGIHLKKAKVVDDRKSTATIVQQKKMDGISWHH
jgi:hypothetical protein